MKARGYNRQGEWLKACSPFVYFGWFYDQNITRFFSATLVIAFIAICYIPAHVMDNSDVDQQYPPIRQGVKEEAESISVAVAHYVRLLRNKISFNDETRHSYIPEEYLNDM